MYPLHHLFLSRLTSHDHSVSLLVACSMRLLSSHHPLNSSPPHHMVYCFSAVCELCFGLPFPPPCGAELSFVLTIVFFSPFCCYSFLPFPPSSITIHELVTTRKQQCDDSFCLFSMSDPGSVYVDTSGMGGCGASLDVGVSTPGVETL